MYNFYILCKNYTFQGRFEETFRGYHTYVVMNVEIANTR